MTLRVIREPSINAATMGIVLLDGRFFGWSVEDEIREVPGQPVARWKVAGQTAIPAGRYRVALTPSPRFGRVLPELMNVPGFDGIRIHPGNTSEDTAGCLLLGLTRRPENAGVSESIVACQRVQAAMDAAAARGEMTWALIENPLV